jgi:hypothetical protein
MEISDEDAVLRRERDLVSRNCGHLGQAGLTNLDQLEFRRAYGMCLRCVEYVVAELFDLIGRAARGLPLELGSATFDLVRAALEEWRDDRSLTVSDYRITDQLWGVTLIKR